jgi:hypothetical protein
MFTFSSSRSGALVVVTLLAMAAGLAAYDVAVGADLATAPDAKNSDSAGTLKIKPERHNFGQVMVTLSSAQQTVTATNISKSASIEFTSIVASSPFEIQSDGCSGLPLPAGDSCEVKVVFDPATTGKVKDKKGLTFIDSSKKSPQHVELEGRGVGSAPSPTPSFSATPTLTATPTCTFRATGTSVPTITPVATPTPAPQAGDVFIAGGDTGGTLGATPITSGANSTNGAQVFNANTSAFDAVGSLHTDREGATAVALENNMILVVGGEQCFPATFGGASGYECTALNTAELYDPSTQTFTAAGSGSCGTMTAARAGSTATLINHTQGSTFLDGRILIVGGTSGSSFQSATPPAPDSGAPTGQVAQNSAEIYDPVSDTFSSLAATVPVPSVCGASHTAPCGLVNHAATLIGGGSNAGSLDQGQVLIAGGDLVSPMIESTNLAFIFHPHTLTFSTAAPMSTARELFSLTPVSPLSFAYGSFVTALAAGGVDAASNVCSTAGDLLVTTNDTGEVYNPTNNTWSPVSDSMSAKRAAHSATLLLAGTLVGDTLIAGGIDFEDGMFPSTCAASTSLTQSATASADLYNGSFGATGSLNQARGGQGFGLEGASPASLEPIVIGGECATGTAASYIVGTAAAASSCDADAQTDYSEIFDETSQTWALGPTAPASGVSPSNGPASLTSP